MTTEKKSSGIRSAVKMGEISPIEALQKLIALERDGCFIKPSILKWLKRKEKGR